MQLKTIIIEDEEKTLLVIKELIARFTPNLDISGSAGFVNHAVQLIEAQKPELVLMDVRIGDGTGFDVLRRLSARNFELIFITAFDNYALEAIQYAAIDYLLKPVGIPEFRSAVERASERLQEKIRHSNMETLLHNLAQTEASNRKLSISSVNGYEFVSLSEIMWCKSEGSYTIFYLSDKTRITSSRNIGYYEDIMNTADFIRISNSVIINFRFVKSYSRNQGNLTLSDGTELPISIRRKSEFLEKLKSYPYLKGFH